MTDSRHATGCHACARTCTAQKASRARDACPGAAGQGVACHVQQRSTPGRLLHASRAWNAIPCPAAPGAGTPPSCMHSASEDRVLPSFQLVPQPSDRGGAETRRPPGRQTTEIFFFEQRSVCVFSPCSAVGGGLAWRRHWHLYSAPGKPRAAFASRPAQKFRTLIQVWAASRVHPFPYPGHPFPYPVHPLPYPGIPSHILATHRQPASVRCVPRLSCIVSRPVSGVFPGCPVFTGRLTMRWSCHRPRSLPISWPSRTFSRAQRAGACDDAEKDSPASARGRHGGAFAGPTTRLRARADHHYAWRRLRPAHREDAACD